MPRTSRRALNRANIDGSALPFPPFCRHQFTLTIDCFHPVLSLFSSHRFFFSLLYLPPLFESPPPALFLSFSLGRLWCSLACLASSYRALPCHAMRWRSALCRTSAQPVSTDGDLVRDRPLESFLPHMPRDPGYTELVPRRLARSLWSIRIRNFDRQRGFSAKI